jgi:UDP-N-acetylmuramyl pentapeptide phosphotransferase/UDP-N-acetylglucosamine-1-phosphate transferase
MHDIYFIIVVLLVSFVVASLAYQPVLYYAQKHNIYDNPEARKLQRKPVPVMGGLVVFLGAMAGSLCYWFKCDCSSIIPVQIAMLLMLVIGGWDDIKQLSPLLRFVLEIVIVLALVFVNGYPVNNLHGLWGIYEISPWIAWPLTIFACVGIINAINMIDGIDGLSSGICIMALGIYGLFLFYSQDFVRAALAVAIIGGIIPFFIMNVFGNKSKMFIGDSGTMMLGIALCDMILALLASDSKYFIRVEEDGFCRIAFVFSVLAIPVVDTVRVMLGRIFRGKSPFQPDKTHLHHAFIDYGFHHLETSLMEILLNIMIVGIWWFMFRSHWPEQWQLYVSIMASVIVCFGLYWMLGRRKRIARKMSEQCGISLEKQENLSDKERKKLEKQK